MHSAEEIIGVPELERDIFNQREADYTPPVLLSRLNPKKRASKKRKKEKGSGRRSQQTWEHIERWNHQLRWAGFCVL